jgi:disulfide bond formation protein DsbB
MIGDDPTGQDCEPMPPGPTSLEPLSRHVASFVNADTRRAVEQPWSHMPEGRRISLPAWSIAALVAITLWVVIIKLI